MKEHKDSANQNDRGMKNVAERTVQAEPTPPTRQSIEQLKDINSALAIQVLPMGIADRDTVWALVDQAIQAIDRTGLSYTVGPFETVVEGPLDQLLELASTVHRTVLAPGLLRWPLHEALERRRNRHQHGENCKYRPGH